MPRVPDGKRIRDLRFEHGLSGPQLGIRARVHYSHIFRIEHGDRGASPAVLKRIADALKVKVTEITVDTEEVA